MKQSMRLGLGALALGVCVAAQAAAPVITNIAMVGLNPRLTIHSDLGATNQVWFTTNLTQTNWVVLTNLVVGQSPYWFEDAGAPSSRHRFYRVVAFPTNEPAPPGMALIPAGSFTMGNPSIGDSDITDATPISVTVSAFYMDTNEVSYSQWTNVYAYATNHGYGFVNAGLGKAGNHPVQTVDWYDCVKWSNARSAQGGLTPVYYTDAGLTQVYTNGDYPTTVYPNWAANGYRLPTEAEWEKAARGGLGRQRFPWGNVINQNLANYYGAIGSYSYDLGPNGYHPIGNYPTTSPGTSPVGSFAANGYGLNDMAGNVWEWCWDWYGTPYGQPTTTNPTGPAGPLNFRVLRGGYWYYDASSSRCASRGNYYPSYAADLFGFRCVRGF